ncbi:MAG: hypothetical protein IVW54_20950 [Candidatus Binataceae bacterium]|nr:hypothetical protein [Candidatus Binataceae bacterium]
MNVTIDSGRMKELVRESIEKPDKVTEVAAERFMLVDKDGKTRGALGVLADGSPFLGFYGAGGQPRVAVGVSGEGSSFIDLYDDAGRPRASLGVASDEAWLSLASSSGKSVARVEVPTRGSAQLTFRDEEKNARAQLVTAEDGCSMLLLSDQKGRLRSVMGVLEGATPLAELYDENGKSQVSLRIGRSNSPHLSSMMRREGIAPRWASRPARDHT